MLNNDELYKNLIPLRKFAREGVVTKSYLSILVQRKRLKAVKIGRNYFTTVEWFCDYVKHYAKDDKADILWGICNEVERNNDRKKLIQATESLSEQNSKKLNINSKLTDENPKVSFIFGKMFNIPTGRLVKIVFLMLIVILAVMIMYQNNKIAMQEKNGKVAGAEEKVINIDKGELEQSYVNINNEKYKLEESVSTTKDNVMMMEKVQK
jgi:hypothetical protein